MTIPATTGTHPATTAGTHPATTAGTHPATTAGIDAGAPRRPVRAGTHWAMAGWAAGLLGLFVAIAPTGGLDVPTDAMTDNDLIAAELAGTAGWVWAFQTATFLAAVLAVVFGLGLRRRLAAQGPTGSLLPDAAAIGMVLVAALTLVGGGIGTEMFHTLRHVDETDPDTIASQLMIFNTMSWVWAGGILTTASIAIAGLRHGSVSRGLGRFAAVMSALVVLTQVVPLQYLALAPVSLFLIVAGIAMQRETRRDGTIVRATNASVAAETGDGRRRPG